MSATPSHSKPIRVRQVRGRYARIRITEILIVIGSIILGCVIVVMATDSLLRTGSASTRSAKTVTVLTLAAIATSLIPMLLGVFWAKVRACRNAQRDAAIRFERLSRIIDHPDCRTRLPHRVAEHALCGMVHPIGILRKIAKWLPPGNVIVCHAGTAARISEVVSVDVPFEPIDAARDKEQLNWLSYLSDADFRERVDAGEIDPTKHFEQIDRKDLNVESASLPMGKRIRRWFSRRNPWISIVANIMFVLGMSLQVIVRFIQNPTLSGSRIELVLLFIGILGLVFVGQVVWSRLRSVFLIPGGIAYRKLTLAGRTGKIRRLSAKNASFMALRINDNTPAIAFIAVASPGQAPFIFTTDLYALIGAWRATAPAPTDEQLSQLLDPTR